MSSEREQNGPTQVHPALNYNELTAHMQLNGMNGLNGIVTMNKSFGERGKLPFELNSSRGRILPFKSQELKIFEALRKFAMGKFFTMSCGHARFFRRLFSLPRNIRSLVERIEANRHTLAAFKVYHLNLLRYGGEDSAAPRENSTELDRHAVRSKSPIFSNVRRNVFQQ